MNTFMFLLGFFIVLCVIGYGIYLALEYNKIKDTFVLTTDVKSREQLVKTINQMKIVRRFESMTCDKERYLLTVGLDKLGLTPTLLRIISRVLPFVCVLIGFSIYAITSTITYLGFGVVFALILAIAPNLHYGDIIAKREMQWNTVYMDLWRLKMEASVNDIKQVLVKMSDYYHEKGEEELEFGFRKFYDFFPNDEREIKAARAKVDELFPFEIPKQLFEIIVSAWEYDQAIDDRLDNYKQMLVLKYKRQCENQIATIPMKSTLFSLPFLLVSVLAILIMPCVPTILQALG